MGTTARQRTHEKWLLEITSLPTAAGREDRVVEWIQRWVKRRRDLQMRADRDGNLLVTQRRRTGRAPIYFTAHLDHPAFVVREVVTPRELDLEFRGGVHDPYFEGARLEVFDDAGAAARAEIMALDASAKPFKRVRARLTRSAETISPGCIARWALGTSVIRAGRLHAPACDDLAAAAAALGALDVLRKQRSAGNVGILFTRAEEIGFVGAIGACRAGGVPQEARLLCLENSRSFPESPIGAGPIVRVGDRRSVFRPSLTNRISVLMQEQSLGRGKTIAWQRKLMPGGSCEATAFSAFGYESTCLCLPLGNYHNMRDIDAVLAGQRPARVGREIISVADYHGLIDMLVLSAARLDDASSDSLRALLDGLYDDHRFVLDETFVEPR